MMESLAGHKRTISSGLTFFYKFISTSLWIGIFGFGTFTLFTSQNEMAFQFLMMWIAGSLFIYWSCARLKHVEIDDRNIYISNFFRTVEVPLHEVDTIKENVFINIHPIWISSKTPTGFGAKIMFMPKFSLRTVFFLSHPIVGELLSMVDSAKKCSSDLKL